ncbi:hypothetical protein B6A35_09940 [Staphylococcus aureus]|nr:hypothetical protein B6A35_09940 [Staphylococcus aureus]
MIFSQNLFRRPTPTCIVCRISFRNSFCWGPPRYYLNNSFRILNNDPIN